MGIIGFDKDDIPQDASARLVGISSDETHGPTGTDGVTGVAVAGVGTEVSDNLHTHAITEVPTPLVKGTTTVWNDLPPMPILVAKAGVSAPTLAVFTDNIKQYTFAVNNEIFGATEILHSYKEGTDLVAHVHWATNGTDGTDRAVKWELEYSVCNGLDASPFGESFGASAVTSIEEVIPASTGSLAHIISRLGTIGGRDLRIGAYIVYRFRRITASGTAPTSNPFAIAVGFHAEHDTVGSVNEGSKT